MHRNFLFDLDQTLLDFHSTERMALEIVVTAYGMEYTDDLYAHFKAYNKELWLELERGTISREELFTLRFNDLIARCGAADRGIAPLKINSDFILTMSKNGILMDGALEFISKLKDSIPDARIYIASNGATVNALGRIASTGLDRYIDGTYISESMGVGKPDEEFFNIILKDIAEPKISCIVIGDSLTSDMLGAKNASLSSVWFMPEGAGEGVIDAYSIDYCASSYTELYDVLMKWSSGLDMLTEVKCKP